MAKKKVILTPKQRKFANRMLKGDSARQAVIAAGYSSKNPGQSAAQVMEALREKIPDIMDRIGLTDETLLKKYLHPALNAKETKFFQHEGHVVESHDVIAWGPRENALDMAFKLKGSYAARDAEELQQSKSPLIIVIKNYQ